MIGATSHNNVGREEKIRRRPDPVNNLAPVIHLSGGIVFMPAVCMPVSANDVALTTSLPMRKDVDAAHSWRKAMEAI